MRDLQSLSQREILALAISMEEDDERTYADYAQRLRADFQALLVFVVPAGDAGVQIPAVVVEPRRVCDAPNFVERLLLDFTESDHHIGHLNPGVIDVVLHLHRDAA